MKHGAYHYANKPFNLDEIALLVEKALETTRLRREVRALRATQAQPYSLDRIVGESDAMVGVRALLQKVAASPASTVLLTGESGTGKDLAAKVLHYASDRAAQAVHEHHLLGAARGAARERAVRPRARRLHRRAIGRSAACSRSADGGTVFLDEIGEMVPALQAKLLRFLEEKTFKRVGGVGRHPRRRARHRGDEPQARRRGASRGVSARISYYRLNVLPIALPPLRDARRRHPAAGRLLRRRLQPRVPEARARASTPEAMERAADATAGRATSASCATPSSARCCWPTATTLTPAISRWRPAAPCGSTEAVELPADRHRSRAARTVAGRPGARAERLEPDEGGRRCSA